jgi:Exopolyphosphatase
MAGADPSALREPVTAETEPAPSPKGVLRNGRRLRQVAAIDIGTNSTHLLVAAVDPSLRTFSIELAEKSTTRLGER